MQIKKSTITKRSQQHGLLFFILKEMQIYQTKKNASAAIQNNKKIDSQLKLYFILKNWDVTSHPDWCGDVYQ